MQIVKNVSANGHNDKPLNRTILSNETEVIDESDIRTAPSYTFYAPQKILQRSKFVLDMSRDVLEYLQDWLNVKYPLAKLGIKQCQFMVILQFGNNNFPIVSNFFSVFV